MKSKISEETDKQGNWKLTVNIFVSGDSIVKKKGTNIYVQKICNRSVV